MHWRNNFFRYYLTNPRLSNSIQHSYNVSLRQQLLLGNVRVHRSHLLFIFQIKKGKLNYDASLKQIDLIMPDELAAPMRNALDACRTVADGIKNNCESAYAVAQCLSKNNPKFVFPWKTICKSCRCCNINHVRKYVTVSKLFKYTELTLYEMAQVLYVRIKNKPPNQQS